MRGSYRQRLRYIRWNLEATKVNINQQSMEDKISQLESIYGEQCTVKTLRDDFTYKIEVKGYYKFLYVYESEGNYKIYTTHTYNDAANDGTIYKKNENSGKRAQQEENKKFKELNGVSERAAFGYCDRELIHYCIPKQFYYVNQLKLNQTLHHVSKVDFSSHYPACCCGKLPDWKYHKTVNGYAKPTEKYPFAFYIKSHMCAEYGVFDMHDWKNHLLKHALFKEDDYNLNISDSEEITILCRASKYALTDTMEYFYNIKNSKTKDSPEYNVAKLVLNSAQGYKHLSNVNNTQNRLDHIAAIMIGRANQKMLDKVDEVGYRNVLQIIVDGMLYLGKNEIGYKDKRLGELIQEHTDTDFIMTATNRYIGFKDGKLAYECHSGCDTDLYTDNIEDIYKWKRSANNG